MIDAIKQKLLSGSSFRKDVLWTLAAQVIVMLLAFGITKIVSNILTVDEFGQYNVIRRSVSVLSFVMLAGMGITLPRYIAIYHGTRHYRKIIDFISCSLIFVVFVCLLVLAINIIFSGYLVQIITGSSDVVIYWIAIAYAIGMTFSSLLVAYYRGINDFKNYSITQVSLQLFLFLSLFFIPSNNVRVIFLLWFIISVLFTLCYFIFEDRRSHHIIFRAYRKNQLRSVMKTILVYTSPRLVGDFFLFSFSAFPVIYLSYALSMTDVAYFSVGLTVVNMATPIFSFLGIVLLPYVSGAIAKGLFNDAQKLIQRLSFWYIVLSILITLFFWLFMPYIIRIFFSQDYVMSKDISRILLLSIIPQSMYLLYRNPIDAVATFPYNTLILIVSCIVLFLLFSVSKTLSDYSYSFVCASLVQGCLSVLSWKMLKNKENRL